MTYITLRYYKDNLSVVYNKFLENLQIQDITARTEMNNIIIQ